MGMMEKVISHSIQEKFVDATTKDSVLLGLDAITNIAVHIVTDLVIQF